MKKLFPVLICIVLTACSFTSPKSNILGMNLDSFPDYPECTPEEDSGNPVNRRCMIRYSSQEARIRIPEQENDFPFPIRFVNYQEVDSRRNLTIHPRQSVSADVVLPYLISTYGDWVHYTNNDGLKEYLFISDNIMIRLTVHSFGETLFNFKYLEK